MYFDFAEANERVVFYATVDRIVCAQNDAGKLTITSQAEKGVGWMPRGQRPKKGAESGETWLGSCKRAMSQSNPNGATPVRASGRIGR